MSVYVMSDIHGQYGLYKRMLKKIKFSDNDTLYILGDMIDRGPSSDKLMLDIVDRHNVKCLIGNHELMMFSHYQKDYQYDFWNNSHNGGELTKKQLNKLSKEDKEKIEDYIFNKTYLQIKIKIQDKTFLLSHSYFIDTNKTIKNWKKLPFYDIFDVVWSSPWRRHEYIPKYVYNDDNIHIIGHVPVQAARQIDNIENFDILEPYNYQDKIINIDGGAAYRNLGFYNNMGLICLNLTAYTNNSENFIFTCK